MIRVVMLLVGIDCRFVSRTAGLGTYTRELVSALLRMKGELRFVLFTHADRASDAWITTLPPDTFKRIIVGASHYSFAEQWELPRAIRRSGIDVFFAPHFNVPFFCPVPFVVTIHDLILHRFPGDASFLKRGIYRVIMLRALRNARRVIAVSDFTAQEIASVYGKRIAKKTTVVTEGVSQAFSPATALQIADVRDRFALPDRYLLYVGNAKEHKNISMLIAAHRAASESPLLVLVTADDIGSLVNPADRVLVLQSVDEASLRVLYSGASAFVTASLYEGFCLPILEARACGCPVIAFAISAIPEVAGSRDRLIPPTQEALSAALSDLPQSSDPPESRFSWAGAARDTKQVLLQAFTL